MGGLFRDPLDYLMSDLQLFELVNAPTLLVPARRSFCNKQPIRSGFMPSYNMDLRQYCEHAQWEPPVPPPLEEQQRSGSQCLLIPDHGDEQIEEVEQGAVISEPRVPQDLTLEAQCNASLRVSLACFSGRCINSQ